MSIAIRVSGARDLAAGGVVFIVRGARAAAAAGVASPASTGAGAVDVARCGTMAAAVSAVGTGAGAPSCVILVATRTGVADSTLVVVLTATRLSLIHISEPTRPY